MTVEAPQPPDFAALLSRLDQLRHTERRAASARMVAMIGHLIGTPLNVIAGRAGLIRSNPTPESIDENVRRIEEQVERLSQRIRRLIDYFGLVDAPAETRSVSELLAECRALYGPLAAHRGITLTISAGESDGARIDASLTALLITTLLSLAIRTAADGHGVTLAASEVKPRTLVFELAAPGLEAPPGRLDRLEPPEL